MLTLRSRSFSRQRSVMSNNNGGCLSSKSGRHPTATTPMNINDEPEAPFPTLPLIAMMLVFFIAAIINSSLVMLVSALLPTPLLLWRLFVAVDDWEVRRAAKKTATTSTLNSAASPATAAAPQPTSI